MIISKLIIVFGFMTLAFGSNCCGQNRGKAFIARKRNVEVSKIRNPFETTRQQNTSPLIVKTDEVNSIVQTPARKYAEDLKKILAAEMREGPKREEYTPEHLNNLRKLKEALELVNNDKKKKGYVECEKDWRNCIPAQVDPTMAFMFTMMAIMLRYLQDQVDKHGLDKVKIREEKEHMEKLKEDERKEKEKVLREKTDNDQA